MNNKNDIKFGTDLGILYNKAQKNNIKAEVLRCKEIGLLTNLFETPVKTEVDVKMEYNSTGYCYGINYLFSDESISCIREIYIKGYDIANLLSIRRRRYNDNDIVSIATFDELSTKEIWEFMNDGYDPTLFMEIKRNKNGKESGWAKFHSKEIREIALAIRHNLNYKVLLEEDELGCKHHPRTMKLINQAMAQNLQSFQFIVMPHTSGKGYAFEPLSHYELNYAAMYVPQIFDIISKTNSDGIAVYDYYHMFYIIRAYEHNIPSKELFVELNVLGEPRLEMLEMRRIFEKEVKEKIS